MMMTMAADSTSGGVDVAGGIKTSPASTLKPVLSMGELHSMAQQQQVNFSMQGQQQQPTKVSVNLNEYFGAIEQNEDEEEDIFF